MIIIDNIIVMCIIYIIYFSNELVTTLQQWIGFQQNQNKLTPLMPMYTWNK